MLLETKTLLLRRMQQTNREKVKTLACTFEIFPTTFPESTNSVENGGDKQGKKKIE